MRVFLLLATWCLASALEDPCGRNESIDIHIIGFFPCTASNDTRSIPVDNCDGIDRIPIMRLALEEINERCDLLPGYRLVVDYANSACSSIPSMYHLIQQTDPSQPTKLMILGTACSGASFVMGEIAEKNLNITQVAYTASDSKFARERGRYPRFYRMVPLTEQIADTYITLIKQLKWKRVAVISHDDNFNINVQQHTVNSLNASNIEVLMSASFTSDPTIVLDQIKNVNARIIIAWIPHTVAAKFWCAAVKQRLVGPDFVWFIPGWFRANWWESDEIDCNANATKALLEHTLGGLGNSVLDSDPSRILVSSKTVTQFEEDLETMNTKLEPVKTDIFLNYGYVYDAMWTIVLALNSSISILEDRGLGRLEDFTYDSVEMANVFTEAVANVSFEGISGHVSLQNNGSRVYPSVEIRQYRDGVAVPVIEGDSRSINISLDVLQWQGGAIPRDAPIPTVITSSLAECVIAGVVSSIGILSTIFFLVFNIYYNKHPVVKRSSYRLNSLILVAVLVGFVGTLLHVIKLDDDMAEPLTTTICNARTWSTRLAFTVAFGALFAKVWRLYKVFFNKKMVYRKHLSDKYLFLMVAVIATPTFLILIIQAAGFPLTLQTDMTTPEDDFSTEEIYSECRESNEFIFLAIYYAENCVLALFSMIVAYETQKHVPKYNKLHKYHESAVINLTTILALLLSSVCEAILVIFRLNEVQDGVLLVITLRDCLWMFPMIYLLFIPKLYRVYRGSFVDEKKRLSHYLSVASNPLYGGRFSMSSLHGRRGSSASILSERRPSLTAYLAGRRFSDVSITSESKLNTAHSYDPTTVSSFVPKREVMFSPIHEEVSELEVDTPDQPEDTACKTLPQIKIISDHANMKDSNVLSSELFLELLEEPTRPKLITYKCTEV